MSESGRKALVVIDDLHRRDPAPAPFLAALEAGGITVLQRDCPIRDRIPELITSMRREIDCVILAGGDALMSIGAIALRDSHLPLGILPLGPDCDLATRLGIPPGPEFAAQVILEGHAQALDLGSVNGRPFFSAASVGLSIGDCRALERATKSRAGGLGYAWAALKIALRTRRFSCIIRSGATVRRVRTVQVTVGNGRPYAGGMAMGPDAGAPDLMLDVCSLETTSRWDLLFRSEIFASPDPTALPEVHSARSTVVEVVTRLPLPIHADGEIVTVTPARFSILPGAVTVYAPAPPKD